MPPPCSSWRLLHLLLPPTAPLHLLPWPTAVLHLLSHCFAFPSDSASISPFRAYVYRFPLFIFCIYSWGLHWMLFEGAGSTVLSVPPPTAAAVFLCSGCYCLWAFESIYWMLACSLCSFEWTHCELAHFPWAFALTPWGSCVFSHGLRPSRFVAGP